MKNIAEKISLWMRIKNLAKDESGVGTIELVLILVVLIGLVFIFKTEIVNLLNSVFKEINSQATTIY